MERWSDASAHYEAAISRNAELGAHGSNARVFYEYARMLRVAGRRVEAAKEANRAMKVSERLKMKRLRALSEQLL
jgi:hypothetical protein